MGGNIGEREDANFVGASESVEKNGLKVGKKATCENKYLLSINRRAMKSERAREKETEEK